jgi:3',5'-cyclic AMP phosphodiesterase CpdA
MGTPVDPDYFVLITDTHIDQSLSYTREGENVADNLLLIVQRIMTNSDRLPAGVIINGDAANRDGNPLEYANLKTILAPLSEAAIPVYITLGNHDRRDTFYAAFPELRLENSGVNGQQVGIVETPNCYLFLLDTLESVNKTTGVLGTIQREWLNEKLNDVTDKPVILLGHHYPWPNIQDGTIRGLRDYEPFLEICHAHRQVKAYLFGHSHRWDLRKDQDLHLVNQPTSAGTTASQPTAYLHAWFGANDLRLELDCIDRTAPGNAKWQGVTKTLTYRPGGTSSLDDRTDRSKGILRLRNAPNPFHTTTTISYELLRAGEVTLLIYASDGRLIKNIADSQWQQEGLHQAPFDATSLPAGNYLCRLSVNGALETAKLVMVKR